MSRLCQYAFILVICFINGVNCVIPSGEMKIKGHSQLHLISPASFSQSLPSSEYYSSYYRLLEPTGDSAGCDPTVSKLTKNAAFYLMVSRGTCTFQEKQTAAYNIGAKGVIVYNSLAGIYQGNNYASEIDYDCENGSGYVDHVTSPVYSDSMDALMPTSCTANPLCSSGKCLVTNETDVSLGTKVCCAWDLYLTMGADSTSSSGSSTDIPAVFIRMEDYAYLQSMPDLAKQSVDVKLFKRPLYFQYLSIVLLYLMAVCTASYGSYWVAQQERKQFNDTEIEQTKRTQQQTVEKCNGSLSIESNPLSNTSSTSNTSQNTSSSSTAAVDIRPIDRSLSDELDEDHISHFTETNPLLVGSDRLPTGEPTLQRYSPSSLSDAEKQQRRDRRQKPAGNTNQAQDDTFNLNASHSVLFVLTSSVFLVLLYLVDLTRVVTVLYLMLGATAATTVYMFPFCRSLARCWLKVRTGARIEDSHAYHSLSESSLWNGPYVAASVASLGIAAIWYFYRNSDWAWLLQDFLGISVCLLCLRLIMLPNLQVATMLLGMAFCYDVFFVFISPLLFDSSVMEQVAVGSSPLNDDPNYCEKYPTDGDYCSDNSLPMLLLVPTLFTYLDGSSMLGLGDIVLPGLLMVWAARHDVRQYGLLDFSRFEKGFYPLAVKAYCVGLLLADVAVVVFETGQPALLYIVPCMLGRILYRSYKNDSIAELWQDLPPMKLVAVPIHRDEQDVLMTNSNVVEAEANWKGYNDVCVLDHSHIQPVSAAAEATLSYQHGNSSSSNSSSISSHRDNSDFQNIL